MKSVWKSPLTTNLFFFGFLGVALAKTHGHYSAFFIVCLSVLFFILVKREAIAPLEVSEAETDKNLWSLVALVFAMVPWVFSNLVIHAVNERPFYLASRVASIFLVATIWAFRSERAPSGIRFAFWGACAVATLLSKYFSIVGSPSPSIDVFTTTTSAVRFFIDGLNPYAQEYVDHYGGKFGYRATFGYWPGVLLAVVPAWKGLGDIRYAHLLAEILTFCGLAVVLRRYSVSRFFQWTVPLVWFFFPVSPLVLEQAWTESLLNAITLGIFIAASSRQWLFLGFGVGLFCATKQYGAFMGILSLIYVVREGRQAVTTFLSGATIVFGVLVIPFLVWNYDAFVASSVTVLLDMKLRVDQLSLPALISHAMGVTVPGLFLLAFNLAALMGAAIWMRRREARPVVLFQSLVWVYGVSFLLGKQASCNYYYFLAFLVLLLAVSRTKVETL